MRGPRWEMGEGALLVSTQTPYFSTRPCDCYRSGRSSSKILFCLVVIFFAAFGFWFWSEPVKRGESDASRPRQLLGEGFVSSQACLECHPDQHASWHASYHRTMTQLASNESIMGPFAGEQIEVDGVKAKFTREGEKYFAELALPDRDEEKKPIVMTTGSHHMQVCWTPTGWQRELEMIPFAYLKEDDRWVPRRATFLQPPGTDPSHMEQGRWNRACIRCHTTHGVPGIDYLQMHTHVAEFGIACEACHGPGEAHIAYHRTQNDSKGADPIVNPAKLTHRRSSEICGQCHLVSAMVDEPGFLKNGFPYRPGDDLSTARHIGHSEFGEGHFWPDGVVRTSGREFNGMRNSACYQKGKISCLSCHSMHQTKEDPRDAAQWANDQLTTEALASDACIECHVQFRDPSQLVAHTHHPADSSGSQCYNCHMPHTSYGLLKASRDHQIDSPNVKNVLHTGRPNACNLCHLDKSLGWTADYLSDWYGIKPPPLAISDQRASATLKLLLTGDAGQRALAAWHMGWPPALEASGSGWQAPHLAQLLEDPYDAVRYIAKRSLSHLPGFESFSYDFLCDPASRKEACERAVGIWAGSARELPEDPASVLLDSDGELMREMQQDLLRSRSDREIRLIE